MDPVLAVGVDVSAGDAVVTAPDVDAPSAVAADHGPPHAAGGADELDAVPEVVVDRAAHLALGSEELHTRLVPVSRVERDPVPGAVDYGPDVVVGHAETLEIG